MIAYYRNVGDVIVTGLAIVGLIGLLLLARGPRL